MGAEDIVLFRTVQRPCLEFRVLNSGGTFAGVLERGSRGIDEKTHQNAI